jgi:hypothetical protein
MEIVYQTSLPQQPWHSHTLYGCDSAFDPASHKKRTPAIQLEIFIIISLSKSPAVCLLMLSFSRILSAIGNSNYNLLFVCSMLESASSLFFCIELIYGRYLCGLILDLIFVSLCGMGVWDSEQIFCYAYALYMC